MSEANWRQCLLSGLAAERSRLLWHLLGLDEETLTTSPVFDCWTAKDLLAHVAAWDEVMVERVEMVLAGREEIVLFTGVDEDARNAAFHAERKEWPLQQAVGALVAARAGVLEAFARLSDAEVLRPRRYPLGETSVREWMEWRGRHDAVHVADLVAWWEAQGLKGSVGPKEILQAALSAAREELLACAAVPPPAERISRPVCGEWSFKDVLAHAADWEWLGVEGLQDMAAGQQPRVEHVRDIDAWNRVHCEARRDESWERVWSDLHAAREALLEVLEGMREDRFVQSFAFPWGEEGTAYRWLVVYVSHDREHAGDLRALFADSHKVSGWQT